ncbi:ATP-binding cassette domain-containing protein [Nocardioides convexus]|uniref:ATP-binding cassette domain-containing protein n=1 Tax=Nocardioides convexus TaxID=2712224 RepID=UPI0024185E10|nr:ATP-binding cassette domain-containing protein [Nocardioides convexus]
MLTFALVVVFLQAQAAGPVHRPDEGSRMKHLQASARTWAPLLAIALLAVVLIVVAPAVLSPFRLNNLGKYVCWAIAGVGIGLAWGRGGMLVMGQGVFFGLGGYAMAMHLKPGGRDGHRRPGRHPRLHGALRRRHHARLVGTLPQRAVHPVRHRRRPGRRGDAARLGDLQAAGQGRLLRDPHPGAGGRLRHAARGDDQADRRVQRAQPVHPVLRLQPLRPGQQADDLLDRRERADRVPGRGVAGSTAAASASLLVATRDAEERVRFLGHDPANIKSGRLRGGGGDGERGRCALRADHRHHLPLRRGRHRLDLPDRGGRAGRTGTPAGSGTGRTGRGLRPHLALGVLPRPVDLLPRPAVHRGHPVLPRGAGQRVVPGDGTAAQAEGGGVVNDDYLEVRGLSVSFDGFTAVDAVDLTLLQGRLHFLIGPNGAGKTTLVDAVTGLVPGTGLVRYRNKDLLRTKSHRIVRAGIGRTFQTATVFEGLSVLQNLDIAGGVHRPAWRMLLARRGTPSYVEEALETIGLSHLRDRPAGVLAHGQKQWLEIGMLLVQDARVMLLDEPVAGMSAEEREQTGEPAAPHRPRAHHRRHRARHGVRAQLMPTSSPCCTPARCWPRAR